MKTIADAAEFDREILRSPGLALVDFFTEACAPCRMLAPVLAEISILLTVIYSSLK
jgi:thiol-disulfide isomerase/thioredoxin